MLTSLRRILGNGEKIAIGNKICIGIFSIFYILAIATLLVPSENKDTESANLAEYNKLKQEFETLVRQNASDPDIANLKIEIEKLQTKITEVDEKYLPYLTKLSERRKREIAKVKVKKKLEEDFKLQFSLWKGVHLVYKVRKNMEPLDLSVSDEVLLKKRMLIESVIRELKTQTQLEHTRKPRSFENFQVNVFSALIAYQLLENKPSLNIHELQEISDLPVLF